jgi:hypothetical protein
MHSVTKAKNFPENFAQRSNIDLSMHLEKWFVLLKLAEKVRARDDVRKAGTRRINAIRLDVPTTIPPGRQ